jgi:CBS domain containing-hemolysin-like protein
MEIYFVILTLILLGNLGPLFSSILSKSTIESITLSNKDDETKQKFIELKEKLSEADFPFFVYEFLISAFSIFLTAFYFFNVYLIELYIIYIVVYIFIRIIFKSIGLKLSHMAIFFNKFFAFIYFISKPFILFNSKIETLFGADDLDEASREELNALVEEAMEDGSLDAGEYRILKNIIHFKNVFVSDVMTPRTVIFSYSEDGNIAEFLATPESQLYSRIPVWEGDSLDEGISGYIMTKDILRAALQGKTKAHLKNFKREISFIPENAELDIALNMFLQRKQHIFMVVDEYGGIEGLLTMEDVLETILGAEIVDEADKVVDLRDLAKNLRDKRIASNINKPEADDYQI